MLPATRIDAVIADVGSVGFDVAVAARVVEGLNGGPHIGLGGNVASMQWDLLKVGRNIRTSKLNALNRGPKKLLLAR